MASFNKIYTERHITALKFPPPFSLSLSLWLKYTENHWAAQIITVSGGPSFTSTLFTVRGFIKRHGNENIAPVEGSQGRGRGKSLHIFMFGKHGRLDSERRSRDDVMTCPFCARIDHSSSSSGAKWEIWAITDARRLSCVCYGNYYYYHYYSYYLIISLITRSDDRWRDAVSGIIWRYIKFRISQAIFPNLMNY